MNAYTAKKEISSAKAIVCDDMLLTTDMPTTAGSKMLDGYMSLLEAEVITRLKAAGYELSGKADVGEFAIDLLGETSCRGALARDGVIKNASAEIVKSGDAIAAVCLDVNGSVRRAAAQSGLVSLKATYGTVSRYSQTARTPAAKYSTLSRDMMIRTARAFPTIFAQSSRAVRNTRPFDALQSFLRLRAR